MSGVVVLAIAVFAYVSFLAALAYAVGFVGNWLVPRSIDAAPVDDWPAAVTVNVLLLALFAVQHTIMARPAFKRWLTRLVPQALERSLFVLASSACLGLLFWQWRALPAIVWEVRQSIVARSLEALSLAGFALAVYSSFVIDHFELFGLKQAWNALRGRPQPRSPFSRRSVYRWVRHPLMSGFLLGFWATPRMTAGHLLFSVVVTLYIFFGTWIEERDLRRSLGAEYAEYCRTTPRFLPTFR